MPSYNPFSDEAIADPFPFYAELRRGPRAFHVEGTDIYVLSRYEDVAYASKHHEIFSSTGGVGPDWDPHPMLSMYDPPEHTRLRRIVARAFTPKTVDGMVATIRADAARLWSELSARGSADLIADYAEPLVAAMIADLIGIPHELRPAFRRWSIVITSTLGKNVAEAAKARAEEERRELVRTLRALVASARASGGSGLISVLVDANHDERLTEPELVAFCVLLLVAGFETTVNGIANTVATFDANPDAFRVLREAPSRASRLVEEALRVDPPVHAFFRNTLSPATFADGSRIPEKCKVMLNFASANRDAAKFADPDRFDVDRDASDHMAFGQGVHTCLGAPLARRVLTISVEEALAATSTLAVDGEPVRTHNTILRGYKSLPVRLTPR